LQTTSARKPIKGLKDAKFSLVLFIKNKQRITARGLEPRVR